VGQTPVVLAVLEPLLQLQDHLSLMLVVAVAQIILVRAVLAVLVVEGAVLMALMLHKLL
jgi:hypothetical protein